MDSSMKAKGKKLSKYRGYPLMLQSPPANTHPAHHYQVPNMYPFYHQLPVPSSHYHPMMLPAGASHLPAYNTPQIMAGWQLLTSPYVPQLTPASIQPILQYPSTSTPNHYQLLLNKLTDAAAEERRHQPTINAVPFVTEYDTDNEDSAGEEEEGEDRHAPLTGHMTLRHMRSSLVQMLTETIASELIFKSLLRRLLEDQEVTTGHTSLSSSHASIDEVTNTTTDHDDGSVAMDTKETGIDKANMANTITKLMIRESVLKHLIAILTKE